MGSAFTLWVFLVSVLVIFPPGCVIKDVGSNLILFVFFFLIEWKWTRTAERRYVLRRACPLKVAGQMLVTLRLCPSAWMWLWLLSESSAVHCSRSGSSTSFTRKCSPNQLFAHRDATKRSFNTVNRLCLCQVRTALTLMWLLVFWLHGDLQGSSCSLIADLSP